jgi:hypothetical protein
VKIIRDKYKNDVGRQNNLLADEENLLFLGDTLLNDEFEYTETNI